MNNTTSDAPSESNSAAVIVLSIFGIAIFVILLIYIIRLLLKCYRSYKAEKTLQNPEACLQKEYEHFRNLKRLEVESIKLEL